VAVASGLVIGVGGAVATAAPATAGEDPGEKRVVDCQRLVIDADRDGQDSVHPWRAVLRDGTGTLLRVLWQSGNWEQDADLGTDLQALIDKEWTLTGSFQAHADIENAPNGWITLEWWDVTPDTAGAPEGWKRWGGTDVIEWRYERPCGLVGEPEVTQPTCDTPTGSITIPDPGEETVTFTINGQVALPGAHPVGPGSYEVTALRIGNKKNYAKTWVVEIVAPECPTPTPPPPESPAPESPAPESPAPESPEPGEGGGLPVTGASTGFVALVASLLVAFGSAMYLVARRRRIRFTA
jgi:hypothetical protein